MRGAFNGASPLVPFSIAPHNACTEVPQLASFCRETEKAPGLFHAVSTPQESWMFVPAPIIGHLKEYDGQKMQQRTAMAL